MLLNLISFLVRREWFAAETTSLKTNAVYIWGMDGRILLRVDKLQRLINENENKIVIWELKKKQFPTKKMQAYSSMMVKAFKEKNVQLKKEFDLLMGGPK
jgi:hypothetical protein